MHPKLTHYNLKQHFEILLEINYIQTFIQNIYDSEWNVATPGCLHFQKHNHYLQ